MGSCCCVPCRSCVSKQKRRLIIDSPDEPIEQAGVRLTSAHGSVNLDMTLITKSILVMGYPSDGFEQCYRNPRDEAVEFLLENFLDRSASSGSGNNNNNNNNSASAASGGGGGGAKPTAFFKVYNLCGEPDRQYPLDLFAPAKVYDKTQWFDHTPPTLLMLQTVCRDIAEFLSLKPDKNVAAIHCKAGKGRAGTVASCALLVTRVCNSAEAAADYYGKARTHNAKGITIPSQRRYLDYFGCSLPRTSPMDQPVIIPTLLSSNSADVKTIRVSSLKLNNNNNNNNNNDNKNKNNNNKLEEMFPFVHLVRRDANNGKIGERRTSSTASSSPMEICELDLKGDFCIYLSNSKEFPGTSIILFLHSNFILTTMMMVTTEEEEEEDEKDKEEEKKNTKEQQQEEEGKEKEEHEHAKEQEVVHEFKAKDFDGWKSYFSDEEEERERVILKVTFKSNKNPAQSIAAVD